MADLRAAGADVWVDTSGIPSGSFVAKISEGLAGRQWVVLVMTPEALASPWVRAEVEAGLNAYHAGRMLGVIPFVMRPCRDEEIPILWRTLQRYDANRGYEVGRDQLFAALSLSGAPADPPRLARLGYRIAFLNGAEVILPPMRDVPAGPFLMGSDPNTDNDANKDEQPQH